MGEEEEEEVVHREETRLPKRPFVFNTNDAAARGVIEMAALDIAIFLLSSF